jgi:hypothetical protein
MTRSAQGPVIAHAFFGLKSFLPFLLFLHRNFSAGLSPLFHQVTSTCCAAIYFIQSSPSVLHPNGCYVCV